jgi:hypothetical protein
MVTEMPQDFSPEQVAKLITEDPDVFMEWGEDPRTTGQIDQLRAEVDAYLPDLVNKLDKSLEQASQITHYAPNQLDKAKASPPFDRAMTTAALAKRQLDKVEQALPPIHQQILNQQPAVAFDDAWETPEAKAAYDREMAARKSASRGKEYQAFIKQDTVPQGTPGTKTEDLPPSGAQTLDEPTPISRNAPTPLTASAFEDEEPSSWFGSMTPPTLPDLDRTMTRERPSQRAEQQPQVTPQQPIQAPAPTPAPTSPQRRFLSNLRRPWMGRLFGK